VVLTISESRLLRVLIALRDATGAKTRTPVPEAAIATLLSDDAELAEAVSDELDELERQGFAHITRAPSGGREVQMTAPGKIKAEEFDRLRARTPLPSSTRPTGGHAAGTADAPRSAVAEDWRTSSAEVLDAVTQALSQLPPDSTTVVRSLLDDARKAVADDSRPRARRALTALGAFLGDAASGALGNVLAAQMRALLPRLGA
jgi:hypothetical protein